MKTYSMAIVTNATFVLIGWSLILVLSERRCTVVRSYSDAEVHGISHTTLSCNFAVYRSVLAAHVFRGQTCTKNSKNKIIPVRSLKIIILYAQSDYTVFKYFVII